jgi:hypothetical protein
MKGDFTRQTFRGKHHYRGVLQQQGRVQLDADWNEQVLLQAHLDRLVTTDTVGPHGAPNDRPGMAIVRADGSVPTGPVKPADLRISPGHYYVDGILCENDDLVPLGAQPDLPGVVLPEKDGEYTAYLDVWHEHITALDLPGLREAALGGPDTATRMRTIWQVKIRPIADPPPGRADPPKLAAQAVTPPNDDDPCDFRSGHGYQRLDNQLYRVEIVRPGRIGSGARFVWSRENGSVAARVTDITDNVLTLAAPGRDDRLSFAQGWVEVTDDAHTRRGRAGYFAKIDTLSGTKVTVTWTDGPPPAGALAAEPLARRWESDVVDVPAAAWHGLESGVQIRFQDGTFRAGDYWLIPARTADLEGRPVVPDLTGDVDWPRDGDQARFEPPAGIRHAYADIAGLVLAGGAWTVTDQRGFFDSLTALTGKVVVGYAGGDGQQVLPGNPLPQPLEVSASRADAPAPDVPIRFLAQDHDGRLATTLAGLAGSADWWLDVPTGADGVARCWWLPAAEPGRPGPRLTARRLAPGGDPLAPPIEFSASFGLARDIAYDPGACTRMAGAGTVQAAIDGLAGTPVLVVEDGDGQDGRPGADLLRPVRVRVRSGCGDPTAAATVRFTVTGGAVAPDAAGLAAGALVTDVDTGADGLAACWWRLGNDVPVQGLTATLRTADPAVGPVTFVAGVDRGSPFTGGLHVTGVVLDWTGLDQGVPVANDDLIAARDLAAGLAVVLDGRPQQETVDGKPVLTVTLDLPYPFGDPEMAFWGGAVFGTTPLTLDGQVSLRDVAGVPAVAWAPTADGQAFLGKVFEVMRDRKRGDVLLGRVTLAGRAVSAGDRVVNGLTLGRTAGGRTEWTLPSVDDVRGADFTQWFRLVRSIVKVVLVPNRSSRLSRVAARDALAQLVSRDDLRARLRAGADVAAGPGPDVAAARRAAGNAFRNDPGRHLVLVTADEYAEAAAVLRDSATAARITVDVIGAADPFAAAATRLAAGEPVDGLLTDDAALAAAPASADFPEGYPL